ncbi:MAG: hypothetical protein ACRCSV_04270 [Chlamydiales bacterium]
MDEIEESCDESDFLLAAVNITTAFDKAYNKCHFIQKIFLKYLYPHNFYTLYNELIEKIASKYVEKYHSSSLTTLLETRSKLKMFEHVWKSCGDIPTSDSNSFENNELIRLMNCLAENSKFVFDFLEKSIDVKISNTLNKPNVKGVIHQFINKKGGKIFVIGTLDSLKKDSLSNIPNISEKFEQSSQVFIERMPSPLSNCVDADFTSLARKKNITIEPFESKWDRISLFFSLIKANFQETSFSAPPQDVFIRKKELVSLRIEKWQEGHWDHDDYLTRLSERVQNLLLGSRIDSWLQKTNLLDRLSSETSTVSIVVGVDKVQVFSDIFKDLGFDHTQLV